MGQMELRIFYNEVQNPEKEKYFWTKGLFLNRFYSYIGRKWLDTAKARREEIEGLISESDTIAKPQESSSGIGILKLNLVSAASERYKIVKMLKDRPFVLEECVSNSGETAKFHPESLNTVRVVTVLGKSGKVSILGSFIRFGTGGNYVDNGGKDGILAEIDVDSGMVITNAFDKHRNEFDRHPDSGLLFKGFKIPEFDSIIGVCSAAAKEIPEVPIVGWDVAITKEYGIEIIEGNNRPDAYGLQSPRLKGYKSRLKELVEQ